MQGLVVYAAKSKKVMYSITFVIFPVTKTIFSTRGCFSATLGLKMNIDILSWPYGHLRLSNLSFPALVTPENNHSYQKLFPSLGKWQMNEVKYYCCVTFQGLKKKSGKTFPFCATYFLQHIYQDALIDTSLVCLTGFNWSMGHLA